MGDTRGDEIKRTVKAFIKEDRPDRDLPFDDNAPLISSGILDSLSVIALVAFLENTFEIVLKVYDVTAENLDTIECIASLVEKRQQGSTDT